MPHPYLTIFTSALSTLYGPLDPASIKDPSRWTPPSYPGAGGHKGRYLWTDAFGVICLITLHTETRRTDPDSTIYLTLASRLIQTVHDTLGWNRDGTERLPGASYSNPLGGGLRIGKANENGSDGDGQYHHYLTLWMFALNRMSLATNDSRYNAQAIQLAQAIHNAFFISRSTDRPRMTWKMDSTLSKALVGSEGNLDPIDGYVVFRIIAAASLHFQEGNDQNNMCEEIADYARVMKRKGEHFVSSDPLDLGMTMWTVQWVLGEEWAQGLAERCFEQLYDLFETKQYFFSSMEYRLAFRDFGTALGVRCMSEQDAEKEHAIDLDSYADQVLEAWRPAMEASMFGTPNNLKPITRVMYAAALIPGAFKRGYLGPEPKM